MYVALVLIIISVGYISYKVGIHKANKKHLHYHSVFIDDLKNASTMEDRNFIIDDFWEKLMLEFWYGCDDISNGENK